MAKGLPRRMFDSPRTSGGIQLALQYHRRPKNLAKKSTGESACHYGFMGLQ